MKERFEGTEGVRRLVDCLKGHALIQGNEALAESVAKTVRIKEVEPGDVVINQGGEDTDLLFILVGKFSVQINGREIAVREAGTHVGEMALIDPTAVRSASVAAVEKSVVGIISEEDFTAIANKFPRMWRHIAVELSGRLKERSRFIKRPNIKPMVFIGSSSEQLKIAQKVHDGIRSGDIDINLWTEGIFEASSTAIESLLEVVQNYDFGIIVFGPDDVVVSRGEEQVAPRDNVVFELGLLVGGVGRNRTYIVKPKGLKIKIPSDLLGVTCLEFDEADATSVTHVCDVIRGKISTLGPK